MNYIITIYRFISHTSLGAEHNPCLFNIESLSASYCHTIILSYYHAVILSYSLGASRHTRTTRTSPRNWKNILRKNWTGKILVPYVFLIFFLIFFGFENWTQKLKNPKVEGEYFLIFWNQKIKKKLKNHKVQQFFCLIF